MSPGSCILIFVLGWMAGCLFVLSWLTVEEFPKGIKQGLVKQETSRYKLGEVQWMSPRLFGRTRAVESSSRGDDEINDSESELDKEEAAAEAEAESESESESGGHRLPHFPTGEGQGQGQNGNASAPLVLLSGDDTMARAQITLSLIHI